MRFSISSIVVCLLLHAGAHAAEFTRASHTLIRMTGAIASGDAERLQLVHDAAVTTLRVQSEGGDTLAGMVLGRLIRRWQLDLEVDGYCASSCANYLFPAARHKRIPRGSVLAFHGTAYTTSLSSPEKMRRMLMGAGVKEAELDAAVTDALDVARRQAITESAFAADLGVNPAFYRDFVQVAQAYGRRYPADSVSHGAILWWPSAARLRACYGIANVDDQARPTVLAQGGRYYDDEVASIVTGDAGLAACPR